MFDMKAFQENFITMVASLFRCNVSCSDLVSFWVGSQFALESNYGHSSLTQTNLNLSGMKHPKFRPTTDIFSIDEPVNPKFAVYRDFDSCVQDYVLWLVYNNCTKKVLYDLDSFRDFIVGHNYCPEPTYIDRINHVFESYLKFRSNNS